MMATALTLINRQPAEAADRTAGSLDVIDVWKTIQGEGPFTGVPAVFVRLAGCNLICPGCDTDYTTGRHRVPVDLLAARVYSAAEEGATTQAPTPIIVLTGGEPFRQDLQPLVQKFRSRRILTQIETNGTFCQHNWSWALADGVSIICSPKTSKIHPGLVPFIHALKYVIRVGEVDQDDGLPTSVLGNGLRPARPPWESPGGRVFIQPMDEGDEVKNRRNTELAAAICIRHGYRLSLQTHKIVGLK
jgi:7-carboxy-7-deazaguanine synthase